MERPILRTSGRRWISVSILAAAIPAYAWLCWPAVRRRGFPEIDPFWLSMRWLWVVPIFLSGLFGENGRFRNWSVGVYAVVCSYFFGGTIVTIVPHHVTLPGMLVSTILWWGPVCLLAAIGFEKITQPPLSKFLFTSDTAAHTHQTLPTALRLASLGVVILTIATAFPFAYRAVAVQATRSIARLDALRDWRQGKAIWFVKREAPETFGTSDNCYNVENGLKTQRFRPGVLAEIYCDAYRSTVARQLAEHGPTDKVRDLCTEAELKTWAKNGRFRKATAFPVKHGSAEVSLRGYTITGFNNAACVRGNPSQFLYYMITPEKKEALIVVTDESIWVFAKTGELIQSVGFEMYRQMGISEETFTASR